MKYISFVIPQTKQPHHIHYGFLVNEFGTVVKVKDALQWQGVRPQDIPQTMVDFITVHKKFDAEVKQLQKLVLERKLPDDVCCPFQSIKLLSPVPRPPSMRDGYAFRQHVEAARRSRGLEMVPEYDKFPVFYFTNHQAVIGPGELHVQELHLDRLDFELEVAIVIGKEGRNIKASEADDFVFGFTIMNDFSARTLQQEEMKLSLGPAKGKDFATALGPWLVTRDELEPSATPTPWGEQHNLGMRAFINGKQVSNGNLKDMHWTFAQIIERASYGVTLYPGDIIGSGTVGTGCFLELNGSKITDNQWLKVGDEVALEVDSLGRLEHTVVLD